MTLEYFLREYLTARPLFLSLIRAKEAFLYQKYLPLPRPILDVGCGDGYFAHVAFTEHVNPKNQPIDVGLDLENSTIHESERLRVYEKLVRYDGVHIPFPNNHFATVVSNCVLEHVEHLSTVVSEVHRVLRPGGRFLTTVMAKPWEEQLVGTILFGRRYQSWMRKKQVHRHLLTQKQWSAEFNDAGFTVREIVGYLSAAACRLIDVCHYLSLPSLLTYTLMKQWVVLPQMTRLYPVTYFLRIIAPVVPPERSGALLFALAKKK